MEGLDIEVAKSKKDFGDFYGMTFNLPRGWQWKLYDVIGRSSAIARVEGHPVGFWTGRLNLGEVDSCFDLEGRGF
ncbi:hypothetical protein HNV12_00475 [Methanococcoides sp. SA1]|nr:hypothetical protein [Methanococcoides sp. SA1]